ncbi:MAG: multidrug efflux SMR transporter [Deltaproteobacteria bacterium]|nr:multidrug efflux SMR transporter [Deltaproteobacteria bacterium]
MAWLWLALAGVLETGWAVGLKYTNGFTRLGPSVVTVVMMFGSFVLLSQALRSIPIGTAYAVWVGIGAAGTAIAGIWLFDDPATPARLGFIALLVVSIAGLKIVG